MTTITLDDRYVQTLSLNETAIQLVKPTLASDEKIGYVELKDMDCLLVEIRRVVEDDPRCSEYHLRCEVFGLDDIFDCFNHPNYICWAKDEDGNDVLACFG